MNLLSMHVDPSLMSNMSECQKYPRKKYLGEIKANIIGGCVAARKVQSCAAGERGSKTKRVGIIRGLQLTTSKSLDQGERIGVWAQRIKSNETVTSWEKKNQNLVNQKIRKTQSSHESQRD
jgi:hypothetical protein